MASEPARVREKVLGFRAWSLDGYRLRSLVADASWQVGVNKAACDRAMMTRAGSYAMFGLPEPPAHDAPAHDCECGLYAFHYPSFALSEGDGRSVFGAVLAWGAIEVHRHGFRAQYAEPVILAYHGRQVYEHVNAIKAIAGEMNVPCVELSELVSRAAALGKPIAVELRPKGVAPGLYQHSVPGPAFGGGGMIMSGSGWKVTVTTPPARPRRKPSRIPIAITSGCFGVELGLLLATGSAWALAGVLFCAAMLVLTICFYRQMLRP